MLGEVAGVGAEQRFDSVVLAEEAVAPLPFVVLADVEQDRGAVERRGNIGDLRLRDVDLVHTAMLTWRPVSALQRGLPIGASPQCQQFRTIHSFHRFIHSPSTGETPFEPPSLWACW